MGVATRLDSFASFAALCCDQLNGYNLKPAPLVRASCSLDQAVFSYTENSRARLLKPVSTVTHATNFEPFGA
jgi:hypothetical protein